MVDDALAFMNGDRKSIYSTGGVESTRVGIVSPQQSHSHTVVPAWSLATLMMDSQRLGGAGSSEGAR